MVGEFGPEGGLNSRIRPGEVERVIMLIHREGRRGTAVGEMSVKERGYVVENEEEQGVGNSDNSSNSNSTSSSKRLDGKMGLNIIVSLWPWQDFTCVPQTVYVRV